MAQAPLPKVRRALGIVGAAVVCTAPAALPAVAAAEHVVELIVLNLVRNALAALANVPNPRVEIDVASSSAFLRIAVADNGPGVPAELVPRLFAPFGGAVAPAGLGLVVARRLAELHGGELRLLSNVPGRGAAFAVDLPLAAPAPIAPAAALP